MSLPFSIWC